MVIHGAAGMLGEMDSGLALTGARNDDADVNRN